MPAIKNISQFSKWIETTAKKGVGVQVGLIQKKVVLDLFRRLVIKSPVGNPDLWQNPASAPPGYVGGRFRANWQITIGEPATGTVDSTQADFGKALSALSGQNNVLDGRRTTSLVVWITNNVPYAQRLETGWSGQAPLGIVSVSIAELQTIG